MTSQRFYSMKLKADFANPPFMTWHGKVLECPRFGNVLRKSFYFITYFSSISPFFSILRDLCQLRVREAQKSVFFSWFNSCYKVDFHTEEASVAHLAAVVAHFHGCCLS